MKLQEKSMYSKQFLGLEEAQIIAEAVLAEAASDPLFPIAFAIVDPYGELIYFSRQDNAHPHLSKMAIKKAYTAAHMRRNTEGLHERFKKVASWYTDVRDLADSELCPALGGACIKTEDGKIVGAFGVSGRDPSRFKVSDLTLVETGLKAWEGIKDK
jgi:glc operon protein GlcG